MPMIGFKQETSVKKQPKIFNGIGTVFTSSIINIAELTENLGPERLIEFLNKYVNKAAKIIKKYSGTLLNIKADAVLAFWHPENDNSNHAQLSFDASCALLDAVNCLSVSQKETAACIADIILSTGEIAADFFGPVKQFQVVGRAMDIANIMSKDNTVSCSSVRMNQDTLDLIEKRERIEETSTIKMANLEDLKIFSYSSARL